MPTIYWFRKALRVDDNPSLSKVAGDDVVYPVFILDPNFNGKIGPNRWRFLVESLMDLHQSLTKLGSKLIIIRGEPMSSLTTMFQEWNITKLAFEKDTEPYSNIRDEAVKQLCQAKSVECLATSGHTLYDLAELHVKAKQTGLIAPECIFLRDYSAMLKLMPAEPPLPIPACKLPAVNMRTSLEIIDASENFYAKLGKPEPELPNGIAGTNQFSKFAFFVGGETEAKRRLAEYISVPERVINFRKPLTSPALLSPSTTALSPYLKFGCISVRTVWHAVKQVIGDKLSTPVQESLFGQLYWREYFYFASYCIPNFDSPKNPLCRQIDYVYPTPSAESIRAVTDYANFAAWRDGKTGFPWIDACMIQLRQHGWMHHLARHSVACFLTRGDLYIHWELGRDVFDELLVDADWAMNNGNWLWLSAAQFFNTYFRIYSPITFAQKIDKNGDFIRHFIPQLANVPAKFIYSPWLMSKAEQEKYNCIIGKDYPAPIVDHAKASKANMLRIKKTFNLRNKVC